MRHLILLPILLLTLCAPALAVAPVTQQQLNYRLLRTELDMARKGHIYLVADLANKRIEVRSSGIVLATLPLINYRVWGPMPEPGLHILKEKDKLPERDKIQIPPAEGLPAAKPAKAGKADDKKGEEPPAAPKAPEVMAYEVSDMPTHYDLYFEGGAHLNIASIEDGNDWKTNLRRKYDKEWWFVSRALTSFWNNRRNSPYTELLLTMQPRDAQRLYWALPQGGAFFILPPAAP